MILSLCLVLFVGMSFAQEFNLHLFKPKTRKMQIFSYTHSADYMLQKVQSGTLRSMMNCPSVFTELALEKDIEQTSIADTLEKKNRTLGRMSVAVSYSGAICHTGADMVRATTPGEEFTADFTRWLYWSNVLNGRIAFWFNNQWGVALGAGYGWTKLTDRVPITLDYSRNQKTEIVFSPITLSILHCPNSKTWHFSIDANYYICCVDVVEVSPYWGPPEEFMHAEIRARGFGLACGFEWRRELLRRLYCSVGISAKIGSAEEYDAVLMPEDTRRYSVHSPMNIRFSGIYLSVGISYGA